MQSETSTDSNDDTLPLLSTESTSASITQHDSATLSQSSEVRTAKEVLEHFRWFMQSNTVPLDKIKSDDINKEDSKPYSESVIRSLEYPIKTATESTCQDLEDSTKTASNSPSQDFKDFTKTEMESAMNQTSRKRMNEVSVAQTDNTSTIIKTSRNSPRLRNVFDERVEHVRRWIIQLIKDTSIALKFRIMEGKYSTDKETKTRSIKKAKDVQEEIDQHFDALDEYENKANISKRFKVKSVSTKKNFSASAAKSKKGTKLRKGRIKSLSSLFLHIHKSSSSESSDESVFERINLINFISAIDAYLVSKEAHDHKSKKLEYNAKSAVDDLHISLIQGRSEVKFKIAHTENRSLEDYQNYIKDLKIAANENLNILYTLVLQGASVILPLMVYLNQSREKIVRLAAFLDEERPDVFPKSADKKRGFFEDCCVHYFEN